MIFIFLLPKDQKRTEAKVSYSTLFNYELLFNIKRLTLSLLLMADTRLLVFVVLQLTPSARLYFLTCPTHRLVSRGSACSLSVPWKGWSFDTVAYAGCRDKRGEWERVSRALSCGGDIALLEPALISRHLQFSRLAIHPYFASRHASPNERLCSLHPAPVSCPVPGVTGNHKAWWLVPGAV